MRRSTQTNLGGLSAPLCLFSLMGFAGLFFASSLFTVVTEREATEMAVSEAQEQEQTVQEIDQEYQAWLDQLQTLQAEITQANSIKDAHVTLASLKQESQQANTEFEKSRKKLEQLQHQKAKLQNRLAQLQTLEEKIASMNLSRTDMDRKTKELKAEIESIEAKITSIEKTKVVGREIGDKEIPVTGLVIGGLRRPAVFMECDARGVWIMPERKLLDPSVPPEAQEAFFMRARSKGYVVFFIRPDGFQTFRRYRDVLRTSNKTSGSQLDYGYEPVNADWKLVYPTN